MESLIQLRVELDALKSKWKKSVNRDHTSGHLIALEKIINGLYVECGKCVEFQTSEVAGFTEYALQIDTDAMEFLQQVRAKLAHKLSADANVVGPHSPIDESTITKSVLVKDGSVDNCTSNKLSAVIKESKNSVRVEDCATRIRIQSSMASFADVEGALDKYDGVSKPPAEWLASYLAVSDACHFSEVQKYLFCRRLLI